MRRLVPAVGGGLFGAGLVISDMVDPARVMAFLNVSGGAWDPTLAFVMAGALLPMAIAWRFSRRMAAPYFGDDFPRLRHSIDVRLIGGAAIFGVGWGLVGFCPGPAIAAALIGGTSVWIFLAAMIAGMALHDIPLARNSADTHT